MNLNMALAIIKVVSLLFFSLFFTIGGYFLGKRFTKKEDTERQLISSHLTYNDSSVVLPTSISGVPIQVASLPEPKCKFMMPCGLCQLRKTENGFEKCTLCKEVKNDSLQGHKRQNRQRTDI